MVHRQAPKRYPVGGTTRVPIEDRNRHQETARAQEETAKAQLELKRYVEYVSTAQEPRWARMGGLADALKGKPKAPVEVLFQLHDPETASFANRIMYSIRAAGWEVSIRPIDLDSDAEVKRLSPLVAKNVGLVGVQILAKRLPLPIAYEGNPVGEFIKALQHTLPGSRYTALISTTPDANLPDDLIVVLVGQKQ